MTRSELIERARRAVEAERYPSEYAYYRALVLMIGPGSAQYYSWKPIASRLMLECEPDPMPPIVRPWENRGVKGKKTGEDHE
jgi:hypothetical protein